ncbi:MAG: sigma-54-dependent Fis family transcriptional regulator [Bacteroidetes bacterium]|nr:sigma-54-dependent Fis family transcriptional regulator [Bacteroidota bacterium]
MAKILIVEDDLTFSQLVQNFLQKSGHQVVASASVKAGLRLLLNDHFDLLLLDYRLPDGTGLDLLAGIRLKNFTLPVIIMTSLNDVRTAVRAMRTGAFDYVTKPVNPDELLLIVNSALSPRQAAVPGSSGFVKGDSQQSKKLFEHIDLIAPTDFAVLIQGESGTGKEYVARMIHQQSNRASKPFIAVDCGSLSKELAASELFGHVKGAFTGAIADKQGVFERAGGGTLFLDELGNLNYEVQMKLLRALQEKVITPVGSNKEIAVDVRIITATNDDLANSVSDGQFRLDLYHRINEFKIQLPALRQRAADLDMFIDHFIAEANREIGRNVRGISAEALDVLHRYDWPGNLRELKNVIRRMVLLTQGDEAQIGSLPDEMLLFVPADKGSNDADLKLQNEVNEKKLIQKVLQQVNYNKSRAAKLLNIDRKTLYAKLERYGLN